MWINEFSYKWNRLFFIFVGQESEVPDFHEALWEHMEQEASDELIDGKGHFSGGIWGRS